MLSSEAARPRWTRRHFLATAAGTAAALALLSACGGTGVASVATGSVGTTAAVAAATASARSAAATAAATASSTSAPSASAGSSTARAAATTAPTSQPASSASAAGTRLTLLWPTYTQEKTDWGHSIIAGYQHATPGVTVDGIFTGAPNTDDPYKKLTAMAAAGTPPDAVWLGSGWIAFAAQGVIRALDDLIASNKLNMRDYYAGLVKALQWQNKQYALPLGGQTCVLAINTQLVQQAGAAIPGDDWTFPDAVALAHKLTKADQGQYGISLDWGYWTEWVMADGGDGGTVDDQWQKPDWSIPIRQSMLQLWHDLWAKEQVDASPTYKAQQWKSDDLKFFESGKLGMVAGYSWLVSNFRPTIKSFDWDLRMLPYAIDDSGRKVRRSALYTDEMAITTGSKQAEAAFAFITWTCGPAQLTDAAKGGHITPSLPKVAESDTFLGSSLPPRNMRAYLNEFGDGIGLGLHPAWTQFSGPVGKAIGDAKAGKTDVKTALAQCDDITAKALAAYAAGGAR